MLLGHLFGTLWTMFDEMLVLQARDPDGWKADYWESFEETPLLAAIATYICYGLVVLIGHIRDFLNNIGVLKINACLEPRIPVKELLDLHKYH